MTDEIVLVEADPGWHRQFLRYAAAVGRALGTSALRIDHVGSTALPGIAAKPIVDIDVSVADASDDASYVPALEAAGLELVVNEVFEGEPHRMLRPARRTCHVHVCSAGSRWERVHLLFRDWMRRDEAAEDRRRYEAIKRASAARFRDDRLSYTESKTEVVDQILVRAERWAAQTGWTVETSGPPRLDLAAALVRWAMDAEMGKPLLGRLAELVDSYGWPGPALVGETGSRAAWLLLEQSDDAELQRRCLTLIGSAMTRGQIQPADVARLTDRVCVYDGRPQVYGTQLDDDGLWPIEDEARVDERRAAVGLPPLVVERLRFDR